MTEEELINLADWYNPTEAAKRLAANSGKPVEVSYVRTLARYGKVRTYRISERVRLYYKADIDNYVVEERGEKSSRAKRQKAANEDTQKRKAVKPEQDAA